MQSEVPFGAAQASAYVTMISTGGSPGNVSLGFDQETWARFCRAVETIVGPNPVAADAARVLTERLEEVAGGS